MTILLSGLVFAVVSCKSDDAAFDRNVSERIAQTVERYKTALTLGERWVLEYWPDDDLSYGGWVYVLEFKDGHTVRAWFEGSPFVPQAPFVSEPPVTSSEYGVEFSTAAMLKFVTQNDYLHYFAFPDASNGGYQGRKGDFEFILMSVSPAMDEIVLRGSRTGNGMRMTPLSGEYTPERYLETVRNDQLAVHRTEFRLTVDGEEAATVQRASATYLGDFAAYAQSKVWTIGYSYLRQAVGTNGEPLENADGSPVYETVEVSDNLSAISLPGGVMKLYEPYVFKGDAVPGLAGQSMWDFKWTLGETSAQNGYVCTDSASDIRWIP